MSHQLIYCSSYFCRPPDLTSPYLHVPSRHVSLKFLKTSANVQSIFLPPDSCACSHLPVPVQALALFKFLIFWWSSEPFIRCVISHDFPQPPPGLSNSNWFRITRY